MGNLAPGFGETGTPLTPGTFGRMLIQQSEPQPQEATNEDKRAQSILGDHQGTH
jgi:hypothetical protein